MSKITYTYDALATVLAWDLAHTPGEDGVFLQPEEVTAINTAISNNATAAPELVTATENVNNLTEQLATMTETANAAAAQVTTLTDKLTELEAEVEKLNGKPSGTGTKLSVKEDVKVEQADVKNLTIDNPEHPFNIQAAREVAAMKARKASRG